MTSCDLIALLATRWLRGQIDLSPKLSEERHTRCIVEEHLEVYFNRDESVGPTMDRVALNWFPADCPHRSDCHYPGQEP